MGQQDSSQNTALTAYNSGIMFATAFHMLYRDFPELADIRHPEYAMVVMPAMVNGVIAIELFLKYLIGNDCGRIHHLEKLVEKLREADPEAHQTLLTGMIICMAKKGLEYNEDDFKKDLRLFSNAFIDFRYFYEPSGGGTEVYNMSFVECMVALLQGIAGARATEK